MKDAYYFPHDSNARHDPKILEMISVYGMQGYGWFWTLVELLREQTDYKLDISGKYGCNAMAMQMYTENEAAKKFIDDCINEFHLFESDGECFWSNSLKRRMEHPDEKREKARMAANKRWENRPDIPVDNADAMQTHSGSNASKVNESKVNESKLNTYAQTSDKKSEPDVQESSLHFNFSIKEWEGILDSHKKIWNEAYPECDIDSELAKMEAWILSAGRKGHKKQWQKFITSWLSRTKNQKVTITHGSDNKHFENERVYTIEDQADIVRRFYDEQ